LFEIVARIGLRASGLAEDEGGRVLISGEVNPFGGPLKDSTGKEMVAAGSAMQRSIHSI